MYKYEADIVLLNLFESGINLIIQVPPPYSQDAGYNGANKKKESYLKQSLFLSLSLSQPKTNRIFPLVRYRGRKKALGRSKSAVQTCARNALLTDCKFEINISEIDYHSIVKKMEKDY